jgi:hypothetical protein
VAGVRGDERRRRLGLGEGDARVAHASFAYLTPGASGLERSGGVGGDGGGWSGEVARDGGGGNGRVRGGGVGGGGKGSRCGVGQGGVGGGRVMADVSDDQAHPAEWPRRSPLSPPRYPLPPSPFHSDAASDWRDTISKLESIGLSQMQIEAVTDALAAVLALGQLSFHPPEAGSKGGGCSGGGGSRLPSSSRRLSQSSFNLPEAGSGGEGGGASRGACLGSGACGGDGSNADSGSPLLPLITPGRHSGCAGVGSAGLRLLASLLEVDEAVLHLAIVSRRIVVGGVSGGGKGSGASGGGGRSVGGACGGSGLGNTGGGLASAEEDGLAVLKPLSLAECADTRDALAKVSP